MIRALVFDFDGLILETEGPSYQSWREVFRKFGFPLAFSAWVINIGTTQGEFNPSLELQKRVKGQVDWQEVEARRREHENALVEQEPILPGVVDYLNEARRLGLKLAIASNSSRGWVMRHLTRLGLQAHFDCIYTSNDVQHLKPDPELYLSALRGLGVQADDALALEDSPLGIRAAKAAGLYCVAVPSEITRQLPFDQADFRVRSLTEMPLEVLIQKINAIKTQRAAL